MKPSKQIIYGLLILLTEFEAGHDDTNLKNKLQRIANLLYRSKHIMKIV